MKQKTNKQTTKQYKNKLKKTKSNGREMFCERTVVNEYINLNNCYCGGHFRESWLMYLECGSVFTDILLLAREDEINYWFLSQRDRFLFSRDRFILAFSWNAMQCKQKECFDGKSETGNARTNMLS